MASRLVFLKQMVEKLRTLKGECVRVDATTRPRNPVKNGYTGTQGA